MNNKKNAIKKSLLIGLLALTVLSLGACKNDKSKKKEIEDDDGGLVLDPPYEG